VVADTFPWLCCVVADVTDDDVVGLDGNGDVVDIDDTGVGLGVGNSVDVEAAGTGDGTAAEGADNNGDDAAATVTAEGVEDTVGGAALEVATRDVDDTTEGTANGTIDGVAGSEFVGSIDWRVGVRVVWGSDGAGVCESTRCFCFLFRLQMKITKNTTPTIKISPNITPRTPPTIAPVWLDVFEVGVLFLRVGGALGGVGAAVVGVVGRGVGGGAVGAIGAVGVVDGVGWAKTRKIQNKTKGKIFE
jgi:hypothetical protein